MSNYFDPLFITNPTNIRYLTGFVGVDTRDAYVLLTKDKTYFFTSGLYWEDAKKLKNIELIEISRENPITRALTALSLSSLGFEKNNLTVAEYEKLKQLEIELVPTENIIENKRKIKTKEEIEYTRTTAKVTDQCFTYICKRIRKGTTEAKLAWEIESYIRFHGCELAFSPIVAFGKNSSIPHYTPTRTLLVGKSLVLLDFGAKFKGYCADMTRVVFLGTPNDTWVHAYNTVLAANQKALNLLRDNVRNGQTLDAASREVIAEANLPTYPHSLGHAVGLDIHESPRLMTGVESTLEKNMVITIEPGVYVEGQFGIRIEDLVLIKDNGIEILSKSPKEITIL